MTDNTMKGRVAVVTGGGSGLGREMALRFGRDGAAVIVADQNLDTAKAVSAEIGKAGGKALGLKVDVRDQAEVQAWRGIGAATDFSTSPAKGNS